jgi:hypothetical protein
MATTTSGIAELYADIVADLIPFYDNMVLLPNPQLIVNQYNLSGAVGNTVKIPLTNSWPAGNSSVTDNDDLIADTWDFDPGAVSLTVGKRGAGTKVSEESLEDGGFETVRNAVVTRLSRSIAQATDQAGFNILASGAETALTDISDVDITNDSGLANSDLANADVSFVMSPEAMSYAVKREPVVKMFEDIQNDNHQMVATVRNGFVRTPNGNSDQMVRAIIASDLIAESNATLRASLDMVSTSVANLRKLNAPTDDSGFYAAIVSAAHEFHLAKELNGIGGITTGAIGSVAQGLANQALLEGLIGQAVGCRFYRSNNVPSGIASA